jgi:hypothetical protein
MFVFLSVHGRIQRGPENKYDPRVRLVRGTLSGSHPRRPIR